MSHEDAPINKSDGNENHGFASFTSDTLPEDCLLCGNHKEKTLIPLYEGEDNVGIISLNTFHLAYIKINSYDDDGNLIEETSHDSSTHITNAGDGGFSLSIYENANRGYAEGHLYFKGDTTLDIEKTASLLCQDCLEQIIDDGWNDALTGLGIIDFSTGKIQILTEKVVAFQFGDFYISCRSSKCPADDHSLEMNLLIFYCPERYND